MTYAKGTSVTSRKSRQEIEDLLEKHRATRTYTATEESRAIVGFELEDRRVQFELALPLREDFLFTVRRGRKVKLSEAGADQAWEQACRERWRGLVLALKAKFVSVESGVESFEEAFLAHVVLPNRQTVHRWFKAQLERSYSEDRMPPLLGAGPEAAP